jgi:hypothetical protein
MWVWSSLVDIQRLQSLKVSRPSTGLEACEGFGLSWGRNISAFSTGLPGIYWRSLPLPLPLCLLWNPGSGMVSSLASFLFQSPCFSPHFSGYSCEFLSFFLAVFHWDRVSPIYIFILILCLLATQRQPLVWFLTQEVETMHIKQSGYIQSVGKRFAAQG